MEIWKDVLGYEGLYSVSNKGRVRSHKYNRTITLNTELTRGGYHRVALYKDNAKHKFTVHRLVAITFIDNPSGKIQVNHVDGNKSNNNAINLEWCNNTENVKHAFRCGLAKKKLTPKDALDIRSALRAGVKSKELEEKYSIDQSAISDIKLNKSWTYI